MASSPVFACRRTSDRYLADVATTGFVDKYGRLQVKCLQGSVVPPLQWQEIAAIWQELSAPMSCHDREGQPLNVVVTTLQVLRGLNQAATETRHLPAPPCFLSASAAILLPGVPYAMRCIQALACPQLTSMTNQKALCALKITPHDLDIRRRPTFATELSIAEKKHYCERLNADFSTVLAQGHTPASLDVDRSKVAYDIFSRGFHQKKAVDSEGNHFVIRTYGNAIRTVEILTGEFALTGLFDHECFEVPLDPLLNETEDKISTLEPFSKHLGGYAAIFYRAFKKLFCSHQKINGRAWGPLISYLTRTWTCGQANLRTEIRTTLISSIPAATSTADGKMSSPLIGEICRQCEAALKSHHPGHLAAERIALAWNNSLALSSILNAEENLVLWRSLTDVCHGKEEQLEDMGAALADPKRGLLWVLSYLIRSCELDFSAATAILLIAGGAANAIGEACHTTRFGSKNYPQQRIGYLRTQDEEKCALQVNIKEYDAKGTKRANYAIVIPWDPLWAWQQLLPYLQKPTKRLRQLLQHCCPVQALFPITSHGWDTEALHLLANKADCKQLMITLPQALNHINGKQLLAVLTALCPILAHAAEQMIQLMNKKPSSKKFSNRWFIALLPSFHRRQAIQEYIYSQITTLQLGTKQWRYLLTKILIESHWPKDLHCQLWLHAQAKGFFEPPALNSPHCFEVALGWYSHEEIQPPAPAAIKLFLVAWQARPSPLSASDAQLTAQCFYDCMHRLLTKDMQPNLCLALNSQLKSSLYEWAQALFDCQAWPLFWQWLTTIHSCSINIDNEKALASLCFQAAIRTLNAEEGLTLICEQALQPILKAYFPPIDCCKLFIEALMQDCYIEQLPRLIAWSYHCTNALTVKFKPDIDDYTAASLRAAISYLGQQKQVQIAYALAKIYPVNSESSQLILDIASAALQQDEIDFVLAIAAEHADPPHIPTDHPLFDVLLNRLLHDHNNPSHYLYLAICLIQKRQYRGIPLWQKLLEITLNNHKHDKAICISIWNIYFQVLDPHLICENLIRIRRSCWKSISKLAIHHLPLLLELLKRHTTLLEIFTQANEVYFHILLTCTLVSFEHYTGNDQLLALRKAWEHVYTTLHITPHVKMQYLLAIIQYLLLYLRSSIEDATQYHVRCRMTCQALEQWATTIPSEQRPSLITTVQDDSTDHLNFNNATTGDFYAAMVHIVGGQCTPNSASDSATYTATLELVEAATRCNIISERICTLFYALAKYDYEEAFVIRLRDILKNWLTNPILMNQRLKGKPALQTSQYMFIANTVAQIALKLVEMAPAKSPAWRRNLLSLLIELDTAELYLTRETMAVAKILLYNTLRIDYSNHPSLELATELFNYVLDHQATLSNDDHSTDDYLFVGVGAWLDTLRCFHSCETFCTLAKRLKHPPFSKTFEQVAYEQTCHLLPKRNKHQTASQNTQQLYWVWAEELATMILSHICCMKMLQIPPNTLNTQERQLVVAEIGILLEQIIINKSFSNESKIYHILISYTLTSLAKQDNYDDYLLHCERLKHLYALAAQKGLLYSTDPTRILNDHTVAEAFIWFTWIPLPWQNTGLRKLLGQTKNQALLITTIGNYASSPSPYLAYHGLQLLKNTRALLPDSIYIACVRAFCHKLRANKALQLPPEFLTLLTSTGLKIRQQAKQIIISEQNTTVMLAIQHEIEAFAEELTRHCQPLVQQGITETIGNFMRLWGLPANVAHTSAKEP